ncbi:MAG: crossover junction endodeoxyribonuclease RuvC [Patescibacteria group bacterium]|nr:crossover junction endodeoxyribonuclease RuvC [Patescibacteria group bacterium]MDE1944718.1 crossover junction endodeoxyribonuclease RuvC [Patescibacteria group bacterium]MDE2057262.1 crossover junction endodeoxyribonuclease RuvC [Patescibacteria group bacterium]
MRILAVDPGYDRMGIAVIEGDPSRPTYVWSACITPEKGARAMRLARVYAAVAEALRAHAPDALALETLFFSTNVRTAIGVAEARGAILAAAGAAGTPVVEHSPQAVKLAATGNGRADKAAVARMIPKLVALPSPPSGKRLDDELDALALALCALAARQSTPAR